MLVVHRAWVLLLLCVSVQALGSGPASGADLPESSLIYVSDYFSFVGADNQGHVAFALDNNRGRDGEAFQAEHFVVLHDERRGWVAIPGNGFYDNSKQELTRIPDSEFFQFHGSPESGLTVVSEKSQLTLKIDPLVERTRRTHEGSVTWMGSAAALLTWQGRTIPGRVLYEYLMMPNFNRLTRTYWGLWKDFQGLYLKAGANGDIYLHSQQSERIAALAGKLVGFSVLEERTEVLTDLTVEVLDRDLALGLYRWPTAWTVTWTGAKGPAQLRLTAFDRNKIAGWVIGGFAMALVRGELSYDGRTIPIYGLVELLM